MSNEQGAMSDFIEQRIIRAVRCLLTGRVNELLADMKSQISLIEFTEYRGGSAVVPVITLCGSECSEKERILRLDAYSLAISFMLPETPESELFCYAYSYAICKAVYENVSLFGVVDSAVITGKKYIAPNRPGSGEGWGLVVSMRLTVEGAGYVS